jgi:hypothetical protein
MVMGWMREHDGGRHTRPNCGEHGDQADYDGCGQSGL